MFEWKYFVSEKINDNTTIRESFNQFIALSLQRFSQLKYRSSFFRDEHPSSLRLRNERDRQVNK